MRSNTLFFLLITSCLCLALAQVAIEDCCLKYDKKIRHGIQKYAVDYRWQVPDGSCNIPAIVFTMRKGRVVCADPKNWWVENLMKKIDQQKSGVKRPRKPHQRRPHRG
ncbi:uncharacterized protein V6R79_024522 [Siganus canaliculatus]